MLDELEPRALHDVLGGLVGQALLAGQVPQQRCHLVDEGRHPGRLAGPVGAECIGGAHREAVGTGIRVHHETPPEGSDGSLATTSSKTAIRRSGEDSFW